MQPKIYNVDYERALLSSIIYEPKTMEDIQEYGLGESDFYIPFHAKLFKALAYLYEHSVIEESIIPQYMAGEFDEVSMVDVLAVSPVSNQKIYVEKIKEYAKLRQFRELAHKILQKIEIDGDFAETLRLAYQELDQVEEEGRVLFNITPIDKIEAEEAEFICKSWLPFPKNTVSMVTAGGGVGKSFLLLQAAMRMARDESLKIFMWLSEDSLALSKYRADLIAENILESDLKMLSKNMHIAGADSETIPFLEESRAGVEISAKFFQFKRMLRDYDVVILDPLIAMFGADENNNTHARKFINIFTRWATKEKKTIIFIHHSTKNTSQSRGASAFVDAVRLVYRVEYIKNDSGETIEDQDRYIILDKDNNGAKKYLGATKVKRQIFPQKRAVLEIEYE